MKYVILFLISFNVYAHGSSHPRWRYHVDMNGIEYIECSNDRYTLVSTVHERDLIFHFFSPNDPIIREYTVTNVVKHRELQAIIRLDGELCTGDHRWIPY